MAKPYTDSEREIIREDLMLCVLRLIHENGYIHTSVTNIAQAAGISKAYFYTMFPSKEILITEALKRQERIAVEKAQEIGVATGLDPKEKLTEFLKWVVAAIRNHTFFFLTPGEAGQVSRKLAPVDHEQFFVNLFEQHKKILNALKFSLEEEDIKVFGNLIINLFMVCGSREKDDCYYREAFDDMLDQLVQETVNYVCTRK